MVAGGMRGDQIVWELGMDTYTLLLYLKWIANKDLLYSTGNCSMLVLELGWENEYMCMYGCITLLCA